MRAQSFQNFSRKAILKLQDQLSQHDRCKNLNQRHLSYARRFKSTNQRIATKQTSLCGVGLWFWTANGRDTLIIFNSFTVTNDYNFGAQWPNGRFRRFFLPTNKTFEGICLALAEKFLQKELWILLVFKIILWKLNLVLSLFMNKSTKSSKARLQLNLHL